jgi:hypothetical protein
MLPLFEKQPMRGALIYFGVVPLAVFALTAMALILQGAACHG